MGGPVPCCRGESSQGETGRSQWEAEGGTSEPREADRMREAAGVIPRTRTPSDSEGEVKRAVCPVVPRGHRVPPAIETCDLL